MLYKDFQLVNCKYMKGSEIKTDRITDKKFLDLYFSVLFRSIELISYIYVWNNCRLFELPWDSPWTWYLTLLGVDFAYYCFHRMSHGKT